MPKLNKIDKQLFVTHAKTHYFWNNPSKTTMTKAQIKKLHSKLVKSILERGFNHNSPLV